MFQKANKNQGSQKLSVASLLNNKNVVIGAVIGIMGIGIFLSGMYVLNSLPLALVIALAMMLVSLGLTAMAARIASRRA